MSALHHDEQVQHLDGMTFRYSTGMSCNFFHQWTNYRHQHPHYEVCLVTRGHGDFFYGSQSTSLTPGSVFIANPAVIHEISSYKTHDLELIFYSFSIDTQPMLGSLSPETKLLKMFLLNHLICAQGNPSLVNYEALVIQNERLPKRSPRRYAIYGLLLELIQCLTPAYAEDSPAQSVLLEKAQQALHRHMAQDISIQQLAEACHCCERTLRREVQKFTGLKLSHWIHSQKIHQAMHLLQMNFRVSEASRATGYQDCDRFSRIFKAHTGTSPKAYQKKTLHVLK